jgi:YgiT-type zinc finger domain-containing protein
MRTCPFCRGRIREQRIEHVHRWQDKLYILRNVPAEVCTQCSETFLAPAALRRMDEIVQRDEAPDSEVRVPVFSL